MPHYIVLSCEAMARAVYAEAATVTPVVTVRLLAQGLHNTPKNLRTILQDQIDAIQPGECDAILLVYGICGTSTTNLITRHTPVVLPRAHDCITLYLGSRQRYQQEFDTHPGTYWYSMDYLERQAGDSMVALGVSEMDQMSDVYEQYVQKYGKDNADYLMEAMGEWQKHYDRAVFIDNNTGDSAPYEQRAAEHAQRRGWLFERRQGDRRLVRMLLAGEWSEDEFLVAPPNHRIEQAAGDGLLRAVPVE